MSDYVAAVILLNGKKMLLYLRDNIPSIPYPNNWALIGGHIEKGENILKALKRETKEEIGYELRDEDIAFIEEFRDGVGNLVYIHKAKIDKKINELHLTEGQKLGYFDFEEVMAMEKVPKPFVEFLIKNKDKIFD